MYNLWERVLGCVATVLVAAGAVFKLAGILAKVNRVRKAAKVGETVDKLREAYKSIDAVVDLCKVASLEPTLIDRLLGTVRVSAAGCKIVGRAIQSIASLRKSNIYTNSGLEHLLEGNINNAGLAGGFHHIDSSVGVVDSILNTKTINGLELYEAKVTINGVRKSGISTMFPDKWSRQQVVDAIEEAYGKIRVSDQTGKVPGSFNTYTANLSNGMTVNMFIEERAGSNFGKIISAFPVIN